MTIRLTPEMRAAFYSGSIVRFEELLDAEFVTRWAQVTIPIPAEFEASPDILASLKRHAAQTAETMGGTLVDADTYEIRPDKHAFTHQNLYVWKVRRS